MSHIKNVHAFEKLLGYCTGYGGQYNPGQQNLQVEVLTTKMFNANKVIQDVIAAKTAYNNATNSREIAFRKLPKLCSRVLSLLKSGGASQLTVEDALAVLRKISGKQLVDRLPVATPSETEERGKKRSNGGFDYASRVSQFASLLEMVMNEPNYKALEPELSVQGLQSCLATLRELNNRVILAQVNLGEARNKRNALLYRDEGNVVGTALAIKQYVRGVFGYRSAEHMQVARLNFTKPNVS